MQNVIRNSVRSRVSSSHRRPQPAHNVTASEILISDNDRRNNWSPTKYHNYSLNIENSSLKEIDSENDLGLRRRVISPTDPDLLAPEQKEKTRATSTPNKTPSVHSNLGEFGDIRLPPVGQSDFDNILEIMSKNVDGQSNHSRLYKILVLGEVHSGKSAIIRRFVHNFFHDNYHSTVGVDFHVKLMPYNDEMEIRMQLWDIAGQERFTQMTRAYFKGAMGALVLFDLNNAQSFENVSKWKKDIDEKCFMPDGRKIPVILIGNKCDLPRDKRLPDDVKISQYVQDNGFVPKWFKTSASTGEGVDEAMRILVRYIMAMDIWNEPMLKVEENEDFFGNPQTTVKLRDGKNLGKSNSKKCIC